MSSTWNSRWVDELSYSFIWYLYVENLLWINYHPRSKRFSSEQQNPCPYGAPVLVGADNPALDWDMSCLSALWGLLCAPKSWPSFGLPYSAGPVKGLTFRSFLTLQLCYLVFLDLLWWTQRSLDIFSDCFLPKKARCLQILLPGKILCSTQLSLHSNS